MDFYVHLPSSSSSNYYPENRPSSFRTKFPKPLYLQGQFEVAVTEFSFLNKIKQFSEKHKLIQIIWNKEVKETVPIISERPEDPTTEIPTDEVLSEERREETDSSENDEILNQVAGKVDTIRESAEIDEQIKAEEEEDKARQNPQKSSQEGTVNNSEENSDTNQANIGVQQESRDTEISQPQPENQQSRDETSQNSSPQQNNDSDRQPATKEIITYHPTLETCVLQREYYDSIQALVFDLNNLFERKFKKQLELIYYPNINRCNLVFGNKVTDLVISDRLAVVLGFNNNKFSRKESDQFKVFVSENPPDLQFCATRLFVYCDILESQIVGDTFSPLLFTIALEDTQKKIVTVNPLRSYINVARQSFDSINIFICNEFGEEAVFENGASSLSLHFRPK